MKFVKNLKFIFVISLVLILTGCAKGDKNIVVKVSDNCDFSKRLVLRDNGVNYYTSCIDTVLVEYNGDDGTSVSLFDEIHDGKIMMDEIYDRSLSISKLDSITIFNFDEYYILKCDNSYVFGNIKNGVDKRYCSLENDTIVSLYDLKDEYSYKEAIVDNYYVITDDKIYNSEVMEHFLDAISLEKTAFIRVVMANYDSAITIIDVLYDKEKVVVSVDNTRSDSDNVDDNILVNEYTHLGVYEDEVGKYLYAYNGNVVNTETDDSFLITKIS